MSEEHCIVIGGSHTAAQLIYGLRQGGWQGDITLISAEPRLPYQRPPLSKGYLSGEQLEDDLIIRQEKFYTDHGVDLLLGRRVIAINRTDRSVVLDDGREIFYSKIALATGSKVRRLEVPGHDLEGVRYLRTMDDADNIRRFVAPGRKAVIVGGGYVGLETAATLRKVGLEVTVLEAMPRILQRVTAPEVSDFYQRVHTEEGVRIFIDTGVTAFEGDTRVRAVVCADGSSISADLVVIGVGILPQVELAEAAGLGIENGILVDEYARTSDRDIVAAGDCTNHFNPIYQRHLRLESTQNANDQAMTAAKTLCGKLEAYNSLPWFWSDQYDLKLQIAGLSQGYDQVVTRGSSTSGRSFAAFYYQQGRLIAVDAINRPKEFVMGKRALFENISNNPAMLADESIDINQAFNI